MPADYTQCRVRKQSNECESEKRLVKSQRSGVALTEYGARGALAGRALPTRTACGRKTALPSRENTSIIFFRTGAWTTSNSLAFTIRSPSRKHASMIFFGPELERNRTWETSFAFFYLPPSVGLLLTVQTRFLYE